MGRCSIYQMVIEHLQIVSMSLRLKRMLIERYDCGRITYGSLAVPLCIKDRGCNAYAGVCIMDVIIVSKAIIRGKIELPFKLVAGSWCAGSYPQSIFTGDRHESDIDVFFTSEDSMKIFCFENKLANPYFKSDTADTYRHNGNRVQTIKVYRDTLQSLFSRFDYVHCQFAIDVDGNMWSTQEALVCTLRKHLMFGSCEKGFELDCLRRAFKYHARGYKPCNGTLMSIAQIFSSVPKEELEKQAVMSPGGGQRILRFD